MGQGRDLRQRLADQLDLAHRPARRPTSSASINLARLLPASERHVPGQTDVLNGIAYDAKGDRLFVTGKNWPKLFEIRLRRVGDTTTANP